MNWEALGAIAELVGAIGVIVTLAYLALQIRQNSSLLEQNLKNSHAAAITASTQAFANLRASTAADKKLAALWFQGSDDPMSLDELDRRRYWMQMQGTVEAIAEVFTQTKASGLAPEVWDTQGVARIQSLVATPGGRQFWEHTRMGFPNDFRSVMDKVLSEAGT